MGGIIIGYEIGKLLKKETIFVKELMVNLNLRSGISYKKKFKSFNY